jgi:hypothetical protein
MKNSHPTPTELAAEAREAMRQQPLGPAGSEFDRLVELGWINAKGQLTKLLGGDADPETSVHANGAPASTPKT